MAATVEIQGLDKLKGVFDRLPKELSASIIRNIARKASVPIIKEARHLVPQDTGVTARSIGVLKVRHQLQPYVEVGFKGRSLGPIYLVGAQNRRKRSGASTGSVDKIPNPFHRAADSAGEQTKREMKLDIGKVIARYFRRKGYTGVKG
jgi:hypothetical protein